ncbi:hypothetical protein SAY86_008923 [Trapa natans]|uniref:Exoribonuclease phosphorolytic domain-containing protein n=1 Tax=Trapa natans TaxID=22666 RepID=A0AAN7K9H4_TRANT|nr:hypothetical protein SAY86_008923 [Trapa natans]
MKYSDIGRLNCNVSYTSFSTLQSDHKEYSLMLHKALEGAIILELFPKTTVDVFALILESGGSDLDVLVLCASLALVDAGIMMYDLVTSVSMFPNRRKQAFLICGSYAVMFCVSLLLRSFPNDPILGPSYGSELDLRIRMMFGSKTIGSDSASGAS